MTVRAIAAGIRGVIYRRLRAGRQEELPGLVEELVDWALRYQQPDSEAVERACAAAAAPAPPRGGAGGRRGREARLERAAGLAPAAAPS